jgi:hypothetical protein
MTRIHRNPAAYLAAATFASLACADVVQEQRITPTPRSTSQIFGLGLSFDGTSIAVGAGFENSPSLAGAAYVFTRNAAGQWAQQIRLRGPTPQSADFLGMDLAIEGDTLLIGAPGRDIPGTADAGVVHVYQNIAGVWTLGPTLMPSNPIVEGYFGDTVALAGDLAAIMAWTVAFPPAGGFGGRELYVFERVGGVWTEQARLPAPESYSNGFTASSGLEIGDGVIFVGGSRELHNGSDVGAVATYAKVAGVWQQTGTLLPSDLHAAAHFGQSLAVSNGRLAVSAPQDTVNGLQRAGTVYLFENTRAGWTETLSFHAPTPAERDFFGVHLDIENDALLIGAYQSELQPFTRDGYACLYHFDSNGGLGTPVTITASDGEPHDCFGWRVALNGDRAVVTAIFETLNQGAAYVYTGVAPPCAEDLDGDGAVGLADLAQLLSNFGTSGPSLPGDLDADGDVDLADLADLLSAFGTSC